MRRDDNCRPTLRSEDGVSRPTVVLVLVFLLGIAFNGFVFADLLWWNRLIGPAPPSRGGAPEDLLPPAVAELPAELSRLRASIVFVQVASCDADGSHTGTGFAVAEDYIATAAHVVADAVECGARIEITDSQENEYVALLDGYDSDADLAVLSLGAVTFEPLVLADSSRYEAVDDIIPVVTVGYPLVGAASEPGVAAISGEGNISRFDTEQQQFVTSGLNVNPGNSGGPVFLRSDYSVVGIASAKLSTELAEGIGYVVPINRFKAFFLEKTGRELH